MATIRIAKSRKAMMFFLDKRLLLLSEEKSINPTVEQKGSICQSLYNSINIVRQQ